jgi:hypothetical protein
MIGLEPQCVTLAVVLEADSQCIISLTVEENL